jgi:hypothetical protein
MKKAIIILAVFLTARLHADLTKPLFLREYWGVPRNQDFISGGIPLPMGLVNDADYISVSSPSGTQVPLQTRPLMRWPDGTLRWVLLTFPADAAAYQTTEYAVRFHQSNKPIQPAYAHGTVQISEDTDHLTVSTGPLVFKIRKSSGFNLFDQVLIAKDNDGIVDDELISPALSHGATIDDHFGGQYTSGNDQTVTVKVEEAGPLRAIIRIDGSHSDGANDPRFYGYRCRIIAHAGKSQVTVQYTVKNSYHTPRGPLAFSGMHLGLGANLSGSEQATLYGDTLVTAPLVDSAFVYQPYELGFETWIGDRQVQHGDTNVITARALGWADISDADWGVAVGVYEFASNCPNEIYLEKGGRLQARLWPARYEQGSDSANYDPGTKTVEYDCDYFFLGVGEQKTHQLCFYFHKGDARAAGVADVMGAFNHALRPQMSREWISLSRAVPGEIYPALEKDVPDPAIRRRPLVNLPLFTDAPRARKARGGYYDSWVTFGEAKWRNESGDTEIFENQGTRYFRYLSPNIHRLLESNAWLYADFHQTHVEGLTGFTIPIRPHIWLDNHKALRDPVHSAPLPDGPRNNGYRHQWIPLGLASKYSHFSNRDLFLFYLVSGEFHILDGLYDFTEMVHPYRPHTMSPGTMTPKQGMLSRSHGSAWASAWMAAMVENSRDSVDNISKQEYYLEMMHRVIQGMDGHSKLGWLATMTDTGAWRLTNETGQLQTDGTWGFPKPWMEAIVDMSFVWYLEYFWHDSLQTYLDKHVRAWRDGYFGPQCNLQSYTWNPAGLPSATSASNSRVPGPVTLLYYFSGDSTLMSKLDTFCIQGQNLQIFRTNTDHTYFNKYDVTWSQAYLFWLNNKDRFFQNPIITWNNDPTGMNRANPLDSDLRLCVLPNPCFPTTAFQWTGLSARPVPLEISIFSLSGKRVKHYRNIAANQKKVYWHGRDNRGRPVAGGVYLVKMKSGKKSLVKKIILVK